MKLFDLIKNKLFKKQPVKTGDHLVDFYNRIDEDSRLLSKHGRIEFLTTVNYIEKYLKDGMKIMEIGAATGRYSHYFAQKGFEVDAVELIEHNIEILKQKHSRMKKSASGKATRSICPNIPMKAMT